MMFRMPDIVLRVADGGSGVRYVGDYLIVKIKVPVIIVV